VNDSETAHKEFLLLTEAYEVLKNPIGKKRYDEIYDKAFLHVKLKKEKRYSRRKSKWTNSINRKAKKGRSRGEKFANESNKKFKRRTRWWAIFDLFDVVVEMFGGLLEVFGGL
jgi:DnaJ-class molecular chaperone